MSDSINLEVGQNAPKFSCEDSAGNTHSLDSTWKMENPSYCIFTLRIQLLGAQLKHVISEIQWHA